MKRRKVPSENTGIRAAAALLLSALLVCASTGATAAPVGPATSSTPPGDYMMGPGDILEISVWGFPELTRQAEVSPDGRITLPLAGSVSVIGVPLAQLTALLTKAYMRFIVDPHVMVTVKEYRKLHVSVLGQVTKPGAYDLPLGSRLLDLLAAGGGANDVALVTEAQLIRPGQRPVRVDLMRAMAGDVKLNVPLTGGETLVLPEDLAGYVTVAGEVTKPGRYRLKGDMKVLDVLALAGGLTEKASVTQATLTRVAAAGASGPPAGQPSAQQVPAQGTRPQAAPQQATPTQAAPTETQSLGLDALLFHQDMEHNVTLRPGDIITVPEDLNNKIYVIGDVKSPGAFVMKGDVTLLQAIAMAGGPEQRGFATAKTAYVVRRNGDRDIPQRDVTAGPARITTLGNGRELIAADLSQIMRNPGQDIPVRPGDVLVLPMSSMGAMQSIINLLAGMFIIFK